MFGIIVSNKIILQKKAIADKGPTHNNDVPSKFPSTMNIKNMRKFLTIFIVSDFEKHKIKLRTQPSTL